MLNRVLCVFMHLPGRISLKFVASSALNIISSMSNTAEPALKRIKYNNKWKKRNWEERRSDKGVGLSLRKKPAEENEPFVRIKRRKYAMLLGYSGVEYLGMQRNPGRKTIEEDLFNALLKVNLIPQEAYDQIQNISFQRAARTDKGVSAVRQVVSLKLPEEVDVAAINRNLPQSIRVFAVKRATKGFNSKSSCDGRTYTYMLPTVAFSKQGTDVQQETFRLSIEAHQEINKVLANFVGTKNYHNFTCKKDPNDPSAKRYMVSFECEPPFIRKNVEFTILKVKGQSFMLHQIRKMVGLTLAVVKGYLPPEILTKAWTHDKLNIPRAPGLGLVLDQVHYDRYNRRYGTDGIHGTLDWIDFEDEINKFKEEHIYPTIIDTEIAEKTMLNWLEERLCTHKFDATTTEGSKEDDADSSEDEEGNDEDGIKKVSIAQDV